MNNANEHVDASLGEVADWSKHLPSGFLLCRDIGHNWKPWRAFWAPEANCYERVLRCPRCHTERSQSVSRTGAILNGHYTYPDGYLSKGMGRLVGDARGTLRLESLHRNITTDGRES